VDELWQRCFIALTPDAATRDALAAMPVGAVARRVPADQLHLTVAFLGTIPARKGVVLGDALPSIVGPLPPLRVERIEHWPSAVHPRLVVAAFAVPDELLALEARVRALLQALGLPMDDHRPFRPHVTLARLSRDAAPVREASASPPDPIPCLDTLTLFSSTLARHGARYRPLASVRVPLR
jgi:RNA 2',3'-cyclic 3'-phosphodiesterase